MTVMHDGSGAPLAPRRILRLGRNGAQAVDPVRSLCHSLERESGVEVLDAETPDAAHSLIEAHGPCPIVTDLAFVRTLSDGGSGAAADGSAGHATGHAAGHADESAGHASASPAEAAARGIDPFGLATDADRTALERLTPREREVATFIAQGMSAQEIADEIDRKVTTVISHRRKVLQKIDGKDRLSIARFAFRIGLATP